MASTQDEFAVWTDAAFRRDADAWIDEHVAASGRTIVGAVEQPHVRGWGTALRVPTDRGVLWFKASIPELAYEVALVETLSARAPGRVPLEAACG